MEAKPVLNINHETNQQKAIVWLASDRTYEVPGNVGCTEKETCNVELMTLLNKSRQLCPRVLIIFNVIIGSRTGQLSTCFAAQILLADINMLDTGTA